MLIMIADYGDIMSINQAFGIAVKHSTFTYTTIRVRYVNPHVFGYGYILSWVTHPVTIYTE